MISFPKPKPGPEPEPEPKKDFKKPFIYFYAIDIVFKAIGVSPKEIPTEKLIQLLKMSREEWDENDKKNISNCLKFCFSKFEINAESISDLHRKSESKFLISDAIEENRKCVASFFPDKCYINYLQDSVWNSLIIKEDTIICKAEKIPETEKCVYIYY